MTKPLYAALFAAMLIAFQPIEANAYTSMGAGSKASCGTWLSDREKKDHYALGNWALGYLSGAPWTSPAEDDPLGKTDGAGVLYWLDNYCRANPTARFSDAVRAFYEAHTE